jgi:hypothetical protein
MTGAYKISTQGWFANDGSNGLDCCGKCPLPLGEDSQHCGKCLLPLGEGLQHCGKYPLPFGEGLQHCGKHLRTLGNGLQHCGKHETYFLKMNIDK